MAAAVGPGTTVTHLSGSLGLEVLRVAAEAGARVLAIHPLQTFPDVDSALEGLPGCAIAVTAADDDGSLLGERLAGDVGGEPFRLANDLRPLYHAAAVFASNYLVTTSAIARVAVRGRGRPRSRTRHGTAAAGIARSMSSSSARAHALTGPAVRGDAGTIRRNLEALERHVPDLVPPYVAMARATLDLAERSGGSRPDRGSRWRTCSTHGADPKRGRAWGHAASWRAAFEPAPGHATASAPTAAAPRRLGGGVDPHDGLPP